MCSSGHLPTSHPGDLSTPLSSNIQKGLREARAITRFYSHQAAAINAVAAGRHVIVSTATASGKSVIYQVSPLVPLPRTHMKIRLAGTNASISRARAPSNSHIHLSHQGRNSDIHLNLVSKSFQALAQDQRLAMDQLLRKCSGLDEIQVFTYDGDTPKEKREGVCSKPWNLWCSYLICSYRN